jgi:hypothetical protein
MQRRALFVPLLSALLLSCSDLEPQVAPPPSVSPYLDPQHEITAPSPLLTEDGTLAEPGFSRRELLTYNRENVRADPERLREWDFVTVMSAEAAINVTVADLGFIRLTTVAVLDFSKEKPTSAVLFEKSGDEMHLSSSLDTDTWMKLATGETALGIHVDGNTRTLSIAIPTASFAKGMSGELRLTRPDGAEHLAVATPFPEDPHGFFYEQKVPTLLAGGQITVGATTYAFDESSSFAVIDWGRGVWPAEVMWRWAGAAGNINGHRIALNLGNGFGDTTLATENALFVDGVLHKLKAVEWTYDPESPDAPWTFSSSDGSIHLELSPVAREKGGLELGPQYNRLSKVYGTLSGSIRLPDGEQYALDAFNAFAEEMQIHW